MSKKTVNVRLSDKAIEAIKAKSIEEKRTFSGMVNAILENWSEKQNKPKQEFKHLIIPLK